LAVPVEKPKTKNLVLNTPMVMPLDGDRPDMDGSVVKSIEQRLHWSFSKSKMSTNGLAAEFGWT